jgi:hypothetical protein
LGVRSVPQQWKCWLPPPGDPAARESFSRDFDDKCRHVASRGFLGFSLSADREIDQTVVPCAGGPEHGTVSNASMQRHALAQPPRVFLAAAKAAYKCQEPVIPAFMMLS